MKDGWIFFVIGGFIDIVRRKVGETYYQFRRLFFTEETKRLQVLAGIQKEKR